MSYPPSTSSQSQMFSEHGKPWRFFVEATAVRGRPALIRKILRNGGLIVNSAREADILLAENNTKEALELFEAWRGDKMLLSTRWVARCLQEGNFLGVDRGWGGCEFTRELLLQGIIASEDGSEAEEEEISQTQKRSHRIVSSSPPSKTSRGKSLSESGPSRTPSTPSLSQSRKPSSKVKPVIQQKHSNSTVNAHNFTSQSSGNFHTSQSPPLTMNTSLQASPSSAQTTVQQQEALLAAMIDNIIQSPQQPFNPDVFSSLAQYSTFPQISPLLAPSLQHFFTAASPLALPSRLEPTEQPGLGNLGPQPPGFGVPSGSTQESSTRPTPEGVDADLVSDAASLRSEEREVELTISGKRSAKGRAITDSFSDHDVQTAIRTNPPRAKEDVPKKKLTGIFVDEQRGIPRKFFVMVDIKNRKNLLKIIRKHNGTIVSQMNDAEFIILNNRSNQFQKTLDMLPKHKIAISPTWLEECEDMGKMAEMAPHVIDIASGIGPGASRRKITGAKAYRPMPEDCESEEGSSARFRQPETPKALRGAGTREGNMSSPQRRSESPLPPTNIIPTASGNLFTEEDRIWFFKYARFKLEHDSNMSYSTLLDAIAHKAPHHPMKSWAHTARTKWPGELEMLNREIDLGRDIKKASTLLFSPPTPQDAQNELMYPDSSPPPSLPSSLSLPATSASTLQSSQAESNFTNPLKRKEHPSDGQVGVVAMDQWNKKPKLQDEAIDVDAYLNGWARLIA